MIPPWNRKKLGFTPKIIYSLMKEKRNSLKMEDKLNFLELFKTSDGKSARLNTSKVPNLFSLRELVSPKLISKQELKIITGGEIPQEIRFMQFLIFLKMTVSLVLNYLKTMVISETYLLSY